MNLVNWNCCGSGPHTGGEVRVLPYSRDGNLILCYACYQRELNWRRMRNRELGADAQYRLPDWISLEIYNCE